MSRVESTRNRKYNKKKRKRIAYFEVLLAVSILILFICTHFLQVIFGYWSNAYWMGIEVSSLIIDIILYLAIGLMFILIVLVINRNFMVRGKRKR